MNTDYRISLIRELRDQQVRFAPRAKRNEQADRAETLLSELDPSKNYPYDFLFSALPQFAQTLLATA